jgi:protein arginine kinase
VAKTRRAIEFAIPSRGLSLADALRIIAWIRWAATTGAPGFVAPRTVDAWLTALEVRGGPDPAEAARKRAEFLRNRIESDLGQI